MTFSLATNPSQSDISSAINYLLSNFAASASSDPVTGVISIPGMFVAQYLYKYIQVKYSDSLDGSTNFSNTPTNRQYYGIRNNDSSTESTNPADYVWTKVSGGFSTTKFLYYQTNGGRQIQFQIQTTPPGDSWLIDPGTAIDLDFITAVNGTMIAVPTIYKWTTGSTAPTRPSTTSTYTWSTGAFTPPTGWYSSVPLDTTPGDFLWAIVIPLAKSINVSTSLLDWTSAAYPIICVGSNGATGTPGTNGLNGLSQITGYLVQSQSTATPTFTTPTSGNALPSGWYSTVALALAGAGLSGFTAGYVVWYIFGQYNSTSSTISGVGANTTAWTGPTAASIFQDIRSDNWNGGTGGTGGPPTWGTPATYGTTGYYIVRNTGDSYFGNGVYRGNAIFQGSTVGSTTIVINSVSLTVEYSSYSNNPTTSVVSGNVRTGILGQAVSTASNIGVGVIGINSGTSLSVGVYGEGDIGGYFRGNNATSSIGMYAIGYSTSNIAMAIGQGYFSWGGLNIPAPPNNTTTFLRGDGTWSAASGSTGVTSVSGTSPIVSSGGTTPAISIPAATSSVSGYLTSTDWTTFNSRVSSVGGTGTVNGLTLTGTVTSTGNLTLGGTLSITSSSTISNDAIGANNSATGNRLFGTTSGVRSYFTNAQVLVFLGENGGTASASTYLRGDGTWSTPSFSGVTSVSGTGTVSGLTLTGTVNSTGSLTLGGTLSLTSGNVTTALGFTPYNSTNPSGFITNSTSSLTNYSTTSVTLAYYAAVLASYGNSFSASCTFPGVGFSVSGSGTNSITYTIYQVSDRSLKKNIVDSNLGLEFINKLRPVSYEYDTELMGYKGTVYGLVANDVLEITNGQESSLVYTTTSGPLEGKLAIDYNSYISPLVKAIQELTAKVEALEARLENTNGS